MRRIHLIIGVLGVIAFVLSGQVIKHHHPRMVELPAEVRMMYVSRYIYLLGASLVNVAFGLCLQSRPEGWRRVLQRAGSLLIQLSPVVLGMAFLSEPALGLAGCSWRSYFGMAGVMTHLVASAGREAETAPLAKF